MLKADSVFLLSLQFFISPTAALLYYIAKKKKSGRRENPHNPRR